MRFEDAIMYLRRYQDWRRGYDCRTLKDTGIDNVKLGQAIDAILRHHGMDRPIRDCEARECPHYDAMFGMCNRVHGGAKCFIDEKPAISNQNQRSEDKTDRNGLDGQKTKREEK